MFPVKSVEQLTSRSAPVCLDRSVPQCRNKSVLVEHPVVDMEEVVLVVAMEVKVQEGVMGGHQVQAGVDQETLMMAFCQESLALVLANPRGKSQDMAKGQQIHGCISLMRTVNQV